MKPSPCFSVVRGVRGLLQAAVLPVDWYCLMCNSSKVWIWHMTFSLNSRSSTDTGVLIDSYKDDINAERLHSRQQCFTTSLNRNSRQHTTLVILLTYAEQMLQFAGCYPSRRNAFEYCSQFLCRHVLLRDPSQLSDFSKRSCYRDTDTPKSLLNVRRDYIEKLRL